jgi:glycosyltransferase involved in cell wall biosynthesis
MVRRYSVGMRIAYLVHFRGGRDTGIYRKVREHVTEWTRQGATVGLFVATDAAGASAWADIHETKQIQVLPGRPLFSIVARERLAAALRRWRPDIAYARHGLAYPGFVRVALSSPTIIEVNSDDLGEFRLTSRWRYTLGYVSRSTLLRAASGLVFVTNELAQSPSFASFRKPSVVIANGIDLDAYSPIPAPANERPNLLFLGHPHSPWHGLEHVRELAVAFPDWAFDVVGPGGDEFTDPPENVHVHGLLSAHHYLPIAKRADVAIGSLALYRNGMNEASTLKVREYLARGIPTIIGYRDTDFPEPPPFLLQIPNRPDGVNRSLPDIAAFVARTCGSRVPHTAIAHLDSSVKESRRLEFMEQIASRSHSRT